MSAITLRARLTTNSLQTILCRLKLDVGGSVQRYIDSEVLSRCEPYIPKASSRLMRSGALTTQIGSGEVSWQTPYARHCYYANAGSSKAPMRGNYWLERMKSEGGSKAIARGAAALSGGRVE